MYSEVVYDYFNSYSTQFNFKSKKLTRTNAFKRKVTKKMVVVPIHSNISSNKILKSSTPIVDEDCSQKTTENKSTVSVVYDTVQSIWKYAKSFISNQNLEPSRCHDRLRKKIKHRTSNRSNYLRCLRNIPSNALPRDSFDKKKETVKDTDEKSNTEIIPQETQHDITEKLDSKVAEDFLTIEKLDTSTNLNPEVQLIREINLQNNEKESVCKEMEVYLFDTNNEKLTSTNCEQSVNKKTVEEIPSCKISVRKMQHKNKITEIFIKQNINQTKSDNLNAIEVQILKSSMKTYGRGKRKNKKLHVHFKDEYDNEKPKYSTHTSKNLRKSDCFHPNAFCKKIFKHTPEKKKSTHSIRGKKRRLTLCTKSSRTSFRKKKTKRSSSSTTSIQSKSSDTCTNKNNKKTRKIPKKYSVYATKKICKRKRAKKCKKITASEKGIKTLQQIIKTIADTKLEEPVHVSCNDTEKVIKANNIGDEYNSQHSNINLEQAVTTEKNQYIFEGNNHLEDLHEFAESLNGEELNFENISNINENI